MGMDTLTNLPSTGTGVQDSSVLSSQDGLRATGTGKLSRSVFPAASLSTDQETEQLSFSMDATEEEREKKVRRPRRAVGMFRK